MYPTMEHALQRYGDQVALVTMMIPLESECNRLLTDPAANHQGACITAKLALGVAKLNPAGFASFHDFLMTGKDKPPAMGSIYSKAYVLAEAAGYATIHAAPRSKNKLAITSIYSTALPKKAEKRLRPPRTNPRRLHHERLGGKRRGRLQSLGRTPRREAEVRHPKKAGAGSRSTARLSRRDI